MRGSFKAWRCFQTSPCRFQAQPRQLHDRPTRDLPSPEQKTRASWWCPRLCASQPPGGHCPREDSLPAQWTLSGRTLPDPGQTLAPGSADTAGPQPSCLQTTWHCLGTGCHHMPCPGCQRGPHTCLTHSSSRRPGPRWTLPTATRRAGTSWRVSADLR